MTTAAETTARHYDLAVDIRTLAANIWIFLSSVKLL